MTALGGTGTVRLRLDAGDVARVRLCSTWGRFSESLFSLRLLRERRSSPLVEGWRDVVEGRVEGWTAPLLALTPKSPLIDLHTVVGEALEMDQALKSLGAAPVAQLREELRPLSWWAGGCPARVRGWLRDLLDGDRRAHRELAELFERYYRHAVGPYWEMIQSYLEAERAHRGRIMADSGVEGLLGALHPRIRWRPPFLEVDSARVSGRLQSTWVLGRRCLVLVPSVFCLDGPKVLRSIGDETSPDVLVYPALRDMRDAASLWTPGTAPEQLALAKLLGNTRASALQAIAKTCTTTGLARRLRVAPATASHHISVLRDAHLVTSSRKGNAVDHRVTALGAALLEGDRAGH
jgi:DNA-binding transcriptional ArsR family regulator